MTEEAMLNNPQKYQEERWGAKNKAINSKYDQNDEMQTKFILSEFRSVNVLRYII